MIKRLTIAGRLVLTAIPWWTATLHSQSPQPGPRSPRETLRAADQAQSAFSAMKGFVRSVSGAASDFVMLVEGAPILNGRDAVIAVLEDQQRLANMRVAWQPLRTLVSDDGTLGVTFGATAIAGPNLDQHTFGRYVSVWRHATGDTWQLIAQVQTGLIPPGELRLPAGDVPGALQTTNPRDPFALADLAFAQLARDSTAPVAFTRFAAPNGMTFAGSGELNVGPADIGARLAEGPAARASWRWWPVLTIAAASGDLGITIGEAEITPPGGGTPALSKYMTVWQRQADGSLKYVVDAGSGRPARR